MIELLREMIREMISSPKSRVIKVAGFPITVEVSDDHDSRERGLMDRDSLDPDCGMLFCFDELQPLSFWMRSTRVPLSIAFIDDDGRIQQVESLHPNDEHEVRSYSPCRWALEVNQGWFDERGIRVGSMVQGLPDHETGT